MVKRVRLLSWILAGAYVVGVTAWALVDLQSFRDLAGLLYLPAVPIGMLWLAANLPERT